VDAWTGSTIAVEGAKFYVWCIMRILLAAQHASGSPAFAAVGRFGLFDGESCWKITPVGCEREGVTGQAFSAAHAVSALFSATIRTRFYLWPHQLRR